MTAACRHRFPTASGPSRVVAAAAATFVLAAPATGRAGGEHTEIASAGDVDDPFDLHLTVDYAYEARRAAIKRELAGFPGTDPNGPVPLVKDLVFVGARHVVTPRLSVGVARDLALSASLPVIIRDDTRLDFDQRADGCVFPGGAGEPTCIDARNSTTVQDGILPATGFDADDPGGPGFTDPADAQIFRGTSRKGLDQVHLGATWAAMNQRRDATKPTWLIGAEMRVAVGQVRTFDRARPDRATAVGRGLHEVRLWTSMAKRTSWAEPFVELWWQATVGTTDESGFIETGFGERREAPQQLAGTRFGFEGIIWDDPEAVQHVGIELSTRMEAHFEGRAYTEMWEVFAFAGDTARGGPLALDADPTMAGVQALDHPGVTNVENYLQLGGRARINARLGERVRFAAGFELTHAQSHYISYADAGIDLPTCVGGDTRACEPDDDVTVDPDTAEVNPYHVPLIDAAGSRYRLGDSLDWSVGVSAMILL